MREWGLAGEFRYAGAPDRAGKIALLQEMDVFSVPAVYAEPKGLSLLEAMASGVPVVQPRRGAFTEIVERTGGGVLVAPDDPDALADALLALLTDRARAGALGARRRRGRPRATTRRSAWRRRPNGAYNEFLVGAHRGARTAAPELTPSPCSSRRASRSRYTTATVRCRSWRDVSLELTRGESVAMMGPSGCGKSTLLYLLGALEPPSSGTVTIDGTDPYTLDERAQAAFRGAHIGFVFQDHLLLPQLSALENVLVPTLVAPPDARHRPGARIGCSTAVGLTPRRRSSARRALRRRTPARRDRARARPRAIACCCATSPPATSIARPPTPSPICSSRCIANSRPCSSSSRTAPAVASRFDRRYELRDARLHPIA